MESSRGDAAAARGNSVEAGGARLRYKGDEDYRLYGSLAHEYGEPPVGAWTNTGEPGVPGPRDHDGALLNPDDVGVYYDDAARRYRTRVKPASAQRPPGEDLWAAPLPDDDDDEEKLIFDDPRDEIEDLLVRTAL